MSLNFDELFPPKLFIQYLPHYDKEKWGPVRYMTEGAAAFDLYACLKQPGDNVDPVLIMRPGKVDKIPTGLKIKISDGFMIQVVPRSGHALNGVTVVNSPGTIDCDYTGEIFVIATLIGTTTPYYIHHGDRIAQAIVQKVWRPKIEEVEEMPITNRGSNGFGSTGT